jgi:hypothetical protein
MAITILKMFRVNDTIYSHTIDTETDGTCISAQDGTVILWVDKDAYLTIPGHGRVGYFRISGDQIWSFVNMTGKALPETTVFGKNLLQAELDLAKQYLEDPNAYIEQTS